MGDVFLDVCGLLPADGEEVLKLAEDCLRKVGMDEDDDASRLMVGLVILCCCVGSFVSGRPVTEWKSSLPDGMVEGSSALARCGSS